MCRQFQLAKLECTNHFGIDFVAAGTRLLAMKVGGVIRRV